MDANGSNQTNITNNADGTGQTLLIDEDYQWINDFKWSPDSTKIAFTANHNHIWVINPDGSGRILLAINGESPTWSPDGTKIAFVPDRAGENEIYVMDADGTNQTNLTDSLGSPALNPLWSPDGTKILFTLGANLKQIYVMNADGSNQTKLAEGTSPAWSP